MISPLVLKGPVVPGRKANQDDVLILGRSLQRLGYLKDPPRGLSANFDPQLYFSLLGFQKAFDLKPDGRLLPGGPTAEMLGRLLSENTLRVAEHYDESLSQLAARRRKPSLKQCDHLYWNVDVPTCNAIMARRGKRAAARCHHSAAARYGACLAGTPINELPPLDTWNQ